MSDPSEYCRRLEAILLRAAEYISESELEEARDFATHTEGPEALRSVAWGIINAGVGAPASLIDEIKFFSEGYTYPEGFPQGLDELALPGV